MFCSSSRATSVWATRCKMHFRATMFGRRRVWIRRPVACSKNSPIWTASFSSNSKPSVIPIACGTRKTSPGWRAIEKSRPHAWSRWRTTPLFGWTTLNLRPVHLPRRCFGRMFRTSLSWDSITTRSWRRPLRCCVGILKSTRSASSYCRRNSP